LFRLKEEEDNDAAVAADPRLLSPWSKEEWREELREGLRELLRGTSGDTPGIMYRVKCVAIAMEIAVCAGALAVRC